MFTLFYSGESQVSNIHLARYVGEEGFTSSTGDRVSCVDSTRLILNPFVGKEIRDVSYCSLFSSCVSDRITPKRVKVNKIATTTLEVDGDIEDHKVLHDRCKKTTGKNMVLYGVSSGAPVTFMATATWKYQDVVLIILESCHHSRRDTYNLKYGFLSERLYPYLFGSSEVSPSSRVDSFPNSIPVAFITSKRDVSVSHQSTRRLAQELANKNKNYVYLLVLEKSSHGNYTTDNKHDASNYMMFVNALYERYGAPFEKSYAALGKHMLDRCLLKPKT